MAPKTQNPSLSEAWPTEDISSWAIKAGIKYPVLIDSRIRGLLEVDFQFEGGVWGDHECLMYVLCPLKFLLMRFPAELRYLFSIKPQADDLVSSGIPVIAAFEKDDLHGYHMHIYLDAKALANET